MFKTKCDNYFSNHFSGANYFACTEDERAAAINTAVTDLASCGVQLTGKDDPLLLLYALFEQTLFVLENRNAEGTAEKRKVVSESIDGIGSCRYLPGRAPEHISEKAFLLVENFFRTCRTIRRG